MTSFFPSTDAPFSGVVEYLYTSTPVEIRELVDITFSTIYAIDEFQIKILRALIIILCINLLFIWISWGYYGEKITERFMKPASSKSLEDLKREATELKLPKEHTPRI
jgi:small-conductance mechanosensitive channel